MASTEVEHSEEPTPLPGLPDYLASPNAVLKDTEAQWRYGRAPDYSKTRAVWANSKLGNHEAGSLPQLVENLVKNWEVEASFKTRLADWRTVDHDNYTFAINGGPPQSGEHMLKVGTYNAIIAPNEYYSPENSDFASSHKTFKRMMPTFAWEVLEVYSGPPRVSFKWRHWGTMKNDYVGFNDKGEKVTAKAHGGVIDIVGITIATVDEKVRLQAVDTYFDPLDMFRQIAPNGIVNRVAINKKVFAQSKEDALDDSKPEPDASDTAKEFGKAQDSHDIFHDALSESPAGAEASDMSSDSTTVKVRDDTTTIAGQSSKPSIADTSTATCPVSGQITTTQATCPVSGAHMSAYPGSSSGEWETDSTASVEAEERTWPYDSSVTGKVSEHAMLGLAGMAPDFEAEAGVKDAIEAHLEGPADQVHPHPKTMEDAIEPRAGEAVVAEANSEETIMTHEEMSMITSAECPFLMNRE